MEKLPMCRICLVQNVRMFIVVNRNLRELYEKLTDIPFVTEDIRPILACFFCCAKLKQCYRLLRQCLEAEELFALMMNEDNEPNPLINQDHLEFYSGFIKSPMVHVSIVDERQTECIAIIKKTPSMCEGLDDIIELKEENQLDELEPENLDNSCLDVADTPPHHSESDLEDDVPLIEFKTEVEEEQEVSKKKRRVRETTGANMAKKPKLDTRRTKQEDAVTPEQTEKSDSKVIPTIQKRTSKPRFLFKEPYQSDQLSSNRVKKIKQHTRTQIGEKPYKCDVCQHSFRTKRYLTKHKRIHIRIHTGEKPFKCDICQCSFRQNAHLSNHIRIHTGEKPFKCGICQCSFRQNNHLSKHMRIHTGEKPYKCDVCQRSFRHKDTLTKHISTHTGEKPYKCDVCQRCFSQIGYLKRHIPIHKGEKPYKCDICHSSFGRKHSLTHHIRKHTGEKPFKCDVCQRSFIDKVSLTRHISIHTGDKPYKCDICHSSFGRKHTLTQHIRIHTGEKPFKCDVCQRSFIEKVSLKKHISIHTGDKPYKCDICHSCFGRKNTLTQHINITHR